MLSICIPLYKENVVPFVKELHIQASSLKIPFEIILGDDNSNKEIEKHNRQLEKYTELVYLRHLQTLGFARNRNALAQHAKFPYILFLDADLKLISNNFVQKFWFSRDCAQVLCGGIAYSNTPPENLDLHLKWKHGKTTEERNLNERTTNPYLTFLSANFLIHKTLISKYHFDHTNHGYGGYNDTMYGYQLKQKGILLKHIDNPVLHEGLMSAEKFIKRTEEGVKNLLNFEKQDYVHKESFFQYIKLLKAYSKLKKYKLEALIYFGIKKIKPLLMSNLYSNKPNLYAFSLIKLYYYLKIKKEAAL